MTVRFGGRTRVTYGTAVILAVVVAVAIVVIVGLSTDGKTRSHRTARPTSTSPPSPPPARSPDASTIAHSGTTTSPPSAAPAAGPGAAPVPGPPGAASSLGATPDCVYFPDGSSSPAETLAWTVGVPVGDSQQVQLSSDAHGLDHGQFATSPLLSAKQVNYPWTDHLKAGQSYTWRVITSTANASSPSQSHTFVVERCTGNYTGP